eukprot:778905-Rhodomonas_salina.1
MLRIEASDFSLLLRHLRELALEEGLHLPELVAVLLHRVQHKQREHGRLLQQLLQHPALLQLLDQPFLRPKVLALHCRPPVRYTQRAVQRRALDWVCHSGAGRVDDCQLVEHFRGHVDCHVVGDAGDLQVSCQAPQLSAHPQPVLEFLPSPPAENLHALPQLRAHARTDHAPHVGGGSRDVGLQIRG